MNIKTVDNHTYIYLDKSAFDPLFKETEVIQNTPGMNCDLIKLWFLSAEAGILPQDAQAAVFLLLKIPQNWTTTTDFDLGLDLKQY